MTPPQVVWSAPLGVDQSATASQGGREGEGWQREREAVIDDGKGRREKGLAAPTTGPAVGLRGCGRHQMPTHLPPPRGAPTAPHWAAAPRRQGGGGGAHPDGGGRPRRGMGVGLTLGTPGLTPLPRGRPLPADGAMAGRGVGSHSLPPPGLPARPARPAPRGPRLRLPGRLTASSSRSRGTTRFQPAPPPQCLPAVMV